MFYKKMYLIFLSFSLLCSQSLFAIATNALGKADPNITPTASIFDGDGRYCSMHSDDANCSQCASESDQTTRIQCEQGIENDFMNSAVTTDTDVDNSELYVFYSIFSSNILIAALPFLCPDAMKTPPALVFWAAGVTWLVGEIIENKNLHDAELQLAKSLLDVKNQGNVRTIDDVKKVLEYEKAQSASTPTPSNTPTGNGSEYIIHNTFATPLPVTQDDVVNRMNDILNNYKILVDNLGTVQHLLRVKGDLYHAVYALYYTAFSLFFVEGLIPITAVISTANCGIPGAVTISALYALMTWSCVDGDQINSSQTPSPSSSPSDEFNSANRLYNLRHPTPGVSSSPAAYWNGGTPDSTPTSEYSSNSFMNTIGQKFIDTFQDLGVKNQFALCAVLASTYGSAVGIVTFMINPLGRGGYSLYMAILHTIYYNKYLSNKINLLQDRIDYMNQIIAAMQTAGNQTLNLSLTPVAATAAPKTQTSQIGTNSQNASIQAASATSYSSNSACTCNGMSDKTCASSSADGGNCFESGKSVQSPMNGTTYQGFSGLTGNAQSIGKDALQTYQTVANGNIGNGAALNANANKMMAQAYSIHDDAIKSATGDQRKKANDLNADIKNQVNAYHEAGKATIKKALQGKDPSQLGGMLGGGGTSGLLAQAQISNIEPNAKAAKDYKSSSSSGYSTDNNNASPSSKDIFGNLKLNKGGVSAPAVDGEKIVPEKSLVAKANGITDNPNISIWSKITYAYSRIYLYKKK